VIHATIQWAPELDAYLPRSIHATRIEATAFARDHNDGVALTQRLYVAPISTRDALRIIWRLWASRTIRFVLRRLRGEL
jgi:hypothetical protein